MMTEEQLQKSYDWVTTLSPETRKYEALNQEKWIEECGGTLAGYRRKYPADQADQIYEADIEFLSRLRFTDEQYAVKVLGEDYFA